MFAIRGRNLRQRLQIIRQNNTTLRSVAILMVISILAVGLIGCNSRDRVIPVPNTPVDLTPTNELTIYIPNYILYTDDLNLAIRVFKMSYPSVTVNVESIAVGEGESFLNDYTTRINSELMAGMGPDILLVNSRTVPNFYKTVDNGAFLNVSEIYNNDTELNQNNFSKIVMDVGMYKGGRYVIPYSYNLSVLFGLEETLDSIGFDLSKNTDFISFFDEIERCLSENGKDISWENSIGLMNALDSLGVESWFNMIDYEHRTVRIDKNKIQEFCDHIKPYYKNMNKINRVTNQTTVEDIASFEYIFRCDSKDISGHMFNVSNAKALGYHGIFSAIHSFNGDTIASMRDGLAINANSKNQFNAWNFIKIMLSEEVQKGARNSGPTISLPVNKNAMTSIISDSNYMKDGGIGSFGYYSASGSFTLTDVPLSTLVIEDVLPLVEVFDSITECNINDRNVRDYFINSLEPYLKDERSFEDCISDLEQRLILYVSE